MTIPLENRRFASPPKAQPADHSHNCFSFSMGDFSVFRGDIPVYTAVIADTLEGPDVNDKDALELN